MKKIIACNWKMNLDYENVLNLTDGILSNIEHFSKFSFIIFPSLVHLQKVAELLPSVSLGFQNIYPSTLSAFTGESSIMQLSAKNISYGLVGHSERREYLSESNKFCNEKIRFLLKNQFKVIYCIGESLVQKQSNSTFASLTEQLNEGLSGLNSNDLENVIIAYEPIWAIGTGEVATIDEINTVHTFIKDKLKSDFSLWVPILYGGSVKPSNIGLMLEQENVDGVLVGGASQKFESLKSLF